MGSRNKEQKRNREIWAERPGGKVEPEDRPSDEIKKKPDAIKVEKGFKEDSD